MKGPQIRYVTVDYGSCPKGRKEIIIVGFWCFLGFEFNFLVVSIICNITTNWKFVLSFRINGKKLPSPSTFSDVKIICTCYFKWTFCLVTLSTIVINILILKLYYSFCISKIDSIYRYCLTFSYKCHGVNNYGKKILYAKRNDLEYVRCLGSLCRTPEAKCRCIADQYKPNCNLYSLFWVVLYLT